MTEVATTLSIVAKARRTSSGCTISAIWAYGGDADDPDGVVFTDHRGHRLDRCERPVPPRERWRPPLGASACPAGAWSHPTGERLEPGAVSFHEPAA